MDYLLLRGSFCFLAVVLHRVRSGAVAPLAHSVAVIHHHRPLIPLGVFVHGHCDSA
ncbi:hypothetical protein BC939DRAFT_445778 [Gamsiella multidivaricata]|uniref:uncharacterized protein n=1 Tax=Gamsiella multidivaricata TaxID=101098 RepID=UPI0022202638|nr:uncharacterized protein BC939DRAFT_445778 [Gamsiella multidivaricata]KAI7827101.1 hypothetical protein BC939DRAFT_445778 [Gamsiella multidivaricata]